MSDPAATLALCAWLKKAVATWEQEAKTAMALEPGERKAAKLNGTVIAYTNMVKARKSVKVNDEAALLEFVREYAPTELEAVERINSAYRVKLLERVLKDGKLTGAVDEVWDCVEVVSGEPYLTTKLEPDAGIAVAALLNSGRIGVDGIRALPEAVDRYTQDREAGGVQ